MTKLLQKYLRFWAKIFLKRVRPEIVAISGSVGKTSAKEAIFEVLKIKFGQNIRKSVGNLNNETGVPMAILGYQKSPQNIWGWLPIIFSSPFRSFRKDNLSVLVLEMAADKPGDINYLTKFVHPKIAVLTGIGPAHLAKFGSLEKIIDEKTDLLRALPSDGWAILNIDDEHLKKISYGGRWQTKTFTTTAGQAADLTAQDITTEINNFQGVTKFQLFSENKKYEVRLNTLGTIANSSAALAAAAVGQIYEIDLSAMIEALKNIPAEEHRMQVLAGKNETVIIDDCYNANPMSMKAALDVLRVLPCPQNNGRKIAVLGDMLELGKIESEAHQLIGEYARKVVDEVIAVGGLAKKYQGEKYFAKSDEAIIYLLKNIRKNDIILIKASRSMKLEEIVESLKE